MNERALVRNLAKEKMQRGETVLSMAVRLVRGTEIVSIAHTAGFDSFYVDLEHSSFSLETTSQLCISGLHLGVTPFVRVPGSAPETIARVLDGGALGVIAPHVQSGQQAAEIVRVAKFPPNGERSFTGGLPHFNFRSVGASQMFAELDAATMVIIMIESVDGLAAVDEIAAVEGVDMLFVGTNDLCSSLGIPGQLDHKLVRDAYARVQEACRRHGKQLGVGGLASNPAFSSELVKLGARYVSTGTDLSFLLSAATAKSKQMRDLN